MAICATRHFHPLLFLATIILRSTSSFGNPVSTPEQAIYSSPKCHEFFIPLRVTSINRHIRDVVLRDENSVTDLLSTLGSTNGTFSSVTQDISVSARYCEPETNPHNSRDAIQFLVPGITYTKSYWSALDLKGHFEQTNSWISYASKRGFSTLSIERPGTGQSTRPDPYSDDQFSFQAATMNCIAVELKKGRLLNRPFQKVIYVGHSYGSGIGGLVAALFPDALDALVLTGFSNQFNFTLIDAAELLPAFSVSQRFKGLSSGYLATSSQNGRQEALYGPPGSFHPLIAEYDFAIQDTVSVGELATVSQLIATRYRRPVAVITGENDGVFCFVNSTLLGYCGDGGAAKPAQVIDLFPNTSNFSYFIPSNMGHDVNLHLTAPEAFAFTHDWLEENGF